MIRARTSLRDRGLQLLGMAGGRQGNGTARDVDTLTSAPGGGQSGSRGWSALLRGTAHPAGVDGSDDYGMGLAQMREIENLLGAEADAAVGGDNAAAPDAPVDNEWAPVPPTDWISPLPTLDSRPLPAPPPGATIDEEEAPLPTPLTTEMPSPGQLSDIVLAPLPPTETLAPYFSPDASRVAPPCDAPACDPDLLPVPWLRDSADDPPCPPRSVPLTEGQRAQLLQCPDLRENLADLQLAIQTEFDRVLRNPASAIRSTSGWCHSLLSEARVIVTYREPGDLTKAEWHVQPVRARLDGGERSAKQVYAPMLIALWGIAWFLLFAYLILDPTRVLSWLGLAGLSDSLIVPDVFLRTLCFGGLGGVAAVFHHLFKSARNRSFDWIYVVVYFGKPFLAMILGALIYVPVFVAMRLLGLTSVGLPGMDVDARVNLLCMAVLYFAAMSVGYRENLLHGLLNRVIKVVSGATRRAW